MAFPTTNWAILAEATLSGGETERDAMNQFCERYWHPIAQTIRAKGMPSEKVEDLTQDFIVKLMETSFVKKATQERGAFRGFLSKALRDFLVDEVRKDQAVKRGGGLQRVELQEEVASMSDDGRQFDVAWAEALFNNAVAATGEVVKKRRGEEGWRALEPFLTGVQGGASLQELAAELDLSVNAAKTEVSRIRATFRDNLRSEVTRTVSAPHEVDEELAFLRDILVSSDLRDRNEA